MACLKGASRGLEKGFKGASRGLEKGLKGASRGLEGGLRRASRGLQGGLRRASRGLQGGFKGASSPSHLRAPPPSREGTLQAPLEGYLRRWWLGSSPGSSPSFGRYCMAVAALPLLRCVWILAASCADWMRGPCWLTMALRYLHARMAALQVLGPSSAWY